MGRGSASSAVAVILIFLLYSQMALATQFAVGDGAWTFGVSNWPNGKTFKSGDTLEFIYNPAIHDVAVVDENGYNTCSVPSGSKVYRSGNDNVQIGGGTTYYICTFPGHCQGGMKIAIHAS
ncbi:hypothetical protein RJT34_13339 [Clitoria ternatea]|uniref:Basic blue protein n=1 Tax=Clitoria ternatea TaxID=43366 RepID=A0AAN9PLQ5_CLITE